MRSELRLLMGRRSVYSATFMRYGRYGFANGLRSLLVRNVCHKGKFVCDHLWLHSKGEIAGLSLQRGDVIRFSAEVEPYVKAVGEGHGTDYMLKDVKRIEIVHRPDKEKAA